MRPLRAWYALEDPRIDPPEADLCDECGWRKASNPDCPECCRIAAIREDAEQRQARREWAWGRFDD